MPRNNQAQGEYISIEKLKEWVEGKKVELKVKTLKIMPEKFWRQLGHNAVLNDLLEYINKK